METKTLKSADGTVAHYIKINDVNKLHCWEGPALLPAGNKRVAEYWLFGIQHTKEQWEDKKKDVNGVPFHKTAAGKMSGVRA